MILSGLLNESSFTFDARQSLTVGGIQSSADFDKHIMVDPRAVLLWTSHPAQPDRTR